MVVTFIAQVLQHAGVPATLLLSSLNIKKVYLFTSLICPLDVPLVFLFLQRRKAKEGGTPS